MPRSRLLWGAARLVPFPTSVAEHLYEPVGAVSKTGRALLHRAVNEALAWALDLSRSRRFR